MSLSYRHIFAIVIPTILSNLSVPLVGLVDLVIIGWFNQASYIAAISIGGTIFSMVFWAFGFLRMGITGALGQVIDTDEAQSQRLIKQYLMIALFTGIPLLVFGFLGKSLLIAPFENGDPALKQALQQYVAVRLFAAPFTLINFVILGILITIGKAKWLLLVQLSFNGANIILSFVFGWLLQWDIVGVALGSVLAEIIATVLGLWVINQSISLKQMIQRSRREFEWWSVFSLNSNIFIRTFLLTFAFAWFAQRGAQESTLIAAVNGIMLKFIEVMAFALDGFAYAIESLAARAIGQKNWQSFKQIVKKTTIAATLMAIALGVVMVLYADTFGRWITPNTEVINLLAEYKFWLLIIALTSVFAYILDGVFLSATEGRGLRNGMIFAAAIYAVLMLALPPWFGNHGIWMALSGLMIARTLGLLLQRQTIKSKFTEY